MAYIDNYGNLVTYEDSDGLELRHFGILGMHWGIRRFQPYPGDYSGDGKFVGDKGSNSVSASTNKPSRFETNVKTSTGSKMVDDAVSFFKKNNLPIKPRYGEIKGDAKETVDIGLKAIDTARGPGYIDDPDYYADWFVWEDQTIGMYEIADLARQGKSTSEIKSIAEKAAKVNEPIDDMPFGKEYEKTRASIDKNAGKGSADAISNLSEFYYESLYQPPNRPVSPLVKEGEAFIEECVKEAEKRKNLKHSYELTISNHGYLVAKDDYLAHHGILGMKHGKRNGPPYPLSRGAHSAAERRAGWTKSLASVAKATGKGVARGVVGTAKGVRAVARGTKKALIRVNLYPKKLMSAQDIADKVERLRQEDELKRAMGKLTAADKLSQKIKQKDAMREVAKQTLSQLLPAIGKDVIIRAIQKNQDMKYEIRKKEEMADIDMANEQSKKVWQDIYDAAISANKSPAEAMKLANKGEGKEVDKLMLKKTSQEDKERDKKVWNDLYEDARATGKSAEEARKIADSGKSDIPARAKDDNNKGKGGKQGYDLDSATTKDIYETAKANGYTASQAAEMAKNRDDSVLKGLFGKSSDNVKPEKEKNRGDNSPKQSQDQLKEKSKGSDIPSDVKKDIYNEWVNAGYTPKQAWAKAQAGDDYVGKFKTQYEKQAKDYDETWAAAIKENTRKNAAVKAQATKERKAASQRRQDAIDAAHDEAKQLIKRRGGFNVSEQDGKLIYTAANGARYSIDYESDGIRNFERAEEKRKKG